MNTHPRNKKAGPLTIRVAGEQELKRFNRLLDERHPQQIPHPVGRELRVAIEVESFSDIEARAGTCYKAAGWKPAGMSKGFATMTPSGFSVWSMSKPKCPCPCESSRGKKS
jgi:hypothetical protein